MPASMRDRSRRFVLSHSRRWIWSIERSRNSRRVASSTWPSRWSSVYMRSAAIGLEHAECARQAVGHDVELLAELVDLEHARAGRPLVELPLRHPPGHAAQPGDRHRQAARGNDAGHQRRAEGQEPRPDERTPDLLERRLARREQVAEDDLVADDLAARQL